MKDVSFTIRAIDKTREAFNNVKKSLGDMKTSLSKTIEGFSNLKTMIAAALGGAALKAIADHADHINDLSNRLGIGAEVLSQYSHVAKMTGVEFDTLASGLQKMAKNTSEAALGTGAAKDALVELGLDAGKLSQLGIDQQFEVIAQAMQGVTNDGDKVRLSMALFGKSGAELIPTMEGGAKAIQDMRKRADELGMTLTQTEAGAIGDMKDALDTLIGTLTGVATKIMAHLAPAVTWLATFLSETLVKASDIAKDAFQGLIAFFLKVAGKIVEGIAYMVEKIGALPGLLSDALGAASSVPLVGESFKSASDSVGQLETNIKGFADGMRDSVDVLKNVEVEHTSLADGQKKLAENFAATDKAIKDVTTGTRNLKNEIKETSVAQEHLKQLQGEAKSVFEETRTPLEKYNAELAKLNELLNLGLISQETFNRAVTQAKEQMTDFCDSLEKDAKKVFEETRTPLEKYNEELGKLSEMLKQGLINQDTFNRGVDQAKDKLSELGAKAGDVFEVMKQKGKEAADSLIDKFSDAAFGIGDGFKGMKQMLSDTFKQLNAEILKTTLRSVVFGNANGAGKEGKGGSGGLFGSLMGLFDKKDDGGFIGPMPPGQAANNNNPQGFGKDAGASLADSFTGNMQGFFGGLKDIFGTGGGSGFLGSLGNVMKSATSSFGSVFSSLSSSLGGIFSSIGGGIGSLLGGAGGGMGSLLSMGMSMFGGFFADGGTVSPGKAHIIGERGPEIFVPNSVGSVIPNDAMGGGGGVTVVMNITTPDVQSFRQSQSQIAGDMARQMGKAKRNL